MNVSGSSERVLNVLVLSGEVMVTLTSQQQQQQLQRSHVSPTKPTTRLHLHGGGSFPGKHGSQKFLPGKKKKEGMKRSQGGVEAAPGSRMKSSESHEGAAVWRS